MLPDPKNIGMAVGISLVSCIHAAIYVISYPHPVTGRHLYYTTSPDIGQSSDWCDCSHVASCCLTPQRHSRWKCVAIMFTSWDIRYSISSLSYRPPSLMSYSPWRRAVLTFVTPYCLTHTNMRIPLKFHLYSISNFRYKYFCFHTRNFIFGWTRIEFCIGHCCYQLGDVGILKNKHSIGDLRPLI